MKPNPKSPVKIKLTRGRVALIDQDDYEMISKYSWYAVTTCGNWYAQARVKGERRYIFMHRLIMGVDKTSKPPVDHINRNSLDNRKENLRLSNNSDNLANSKLNKRNLSGYKGVSRAYKKWEARISVNKNQYRIGVYDTPVEAALAYDKEVRKVRGENYSVNYPNSQYYRKYLFHLFSLFE